MNTHTTPARTFIFTAIATIAACFLTPLAQAQPAAPTLVAAATKKPNIVHIIADDLGWKDVGFNGCTDFKTPNIAAIEGLIKAIEDDKNPAPVLSIAEFTARKPRP